MKRLLFLLIIVALQPVAMLPAAEISGTVRQIAGPYLLLQTDTGERVVRTDAWTAYGNLVGLGALKYGGERIRAGFADEVAGVPQATVVTRETEYASSTGLAITVEQVAAGITAGTITPVDCRSRQEWEEGRLIGALHFSGMTELKRIAGEPGGSQEIALYGSFAGDLRPFAVARQLHAAGYAKVRIYGGGVREWRRQGKPVYTSPLHLTRLLSAGTPFRVIDLRQPEAATPPLMAGAELLPLTAFSRARLMLADRSYQLPLFLYGEEADMQKAAGLLAGWGYHNDGEVSLLDPTWKEWPGKYQPGKYIAGTLPSWEIGYDEFRTLWSAREQSGSVLLNVKPGRDRETSGEIHIPLEELPERLEELPRDREIIIYCGLGLRSAVAQRILRQNGFSSRFLNRTLRFDADKNPEPDHK